MKNAISVPLIGALALLALAPGWAGAADPEKKSGPPVEKKASELRDLLRPGTGDRTGGVGNGTGNGDGTGNGRLTPRECRMLRWHMLFDTKDGDDYLSQLRQLGTILAVPISDAKPDNPEFAIVRNLSKKPAPLRKEDVGKIQRIYWIDDNPKNVKAIMAALGHPELKPGYFVAFMPEKLENKLFELETAYRKKHFPKLDEDQIQLTKFKLRAKGKDLEPYVVELRPSKK